MLIDLIKHKEPIIFALFIFVRKYVTFYMSIFITNKYESLYLINHQFDDFNPINIIDV
jgi:hypothetical protein